MALRAGSRHAAQITLNRIADTQAMVGTSVVDTPKSSERISRVTANAIASHKQKKAALPGLPGSAANFHWSGNSS